MASPSWNQIAGFLESMRQLPGSACRGARLISSPIEKLGGTNWDVALDGPSPC